MAAPFAYELGAFDPTFPGITLHYPNEATWKKAGEVSWLYYGLIGPEILKRNPGMSAKDLDPTRVIEELLANPELGIPLSPEGKDEIGRKFIARDPDNAVANLAIASATEHERRHFHDWLLSPYAAEINELRSWVFVNYGLLRRALHADGTTVIPVPLSRWLRKSEAEQQMLIDMWRSLLGEAERIQLPDFTRPKVTKTIEEITARYQRIGRLFEPFEPVKGMRIDGAAIFEASALMIQTHAIHDLFGETASNLFSSEMAGLATPSRYGWFSQAMVMASIVHRPWAIPENGAFSFENDTMSTIATWCLLGSNNADGANAHPLTRFDHALGYVKARGLSNLDLPANEILEELDNFSGVMPYRDLLEHSIEHFTEEVRCLDNMIKEKGHTASNHLLGVFQTQMLVYSWHVHMARLFMDDPNDYCQPVEYLDRSLGKLPEPPLRHTFGRPFYSIDPSMLDRHDQVMLFKDESTPDRAFVRETINQAPRGSLIDLRVADNWQYLCGLADLAFSEYNRDHPEIETQRALAKDEGIRYLEVLS